MRRMVAAVLALGGALVSCTSSSSDPFTEPPPARGAVVAAKVVVDDPAFDPSLARRPRYVPCIGLSGCARSSPAVGDFYPGANIPDAADQDVNYSSQVVLYLVAAHFETATLEDDTIHVRLTPRPAGFEMVKLDASEILTVPVPRYSFEHGAAVLCASGLEGCG